MQSCKQIVISQLCPINTNGICPLGAFKKPSLPFLDWLSTHMMAPVRLPALLPAEFVFPAGFWPAVYRGGHVLPSDNNALTIPLSSVPE